MSRTRSAVAVALGLAVALAGAGCGPKSRLHLGLRDYSTNVVYGSQHKPAPPRAVPGAAIDPGFPAFIQPPLPAEAPAPPARRRQVLPAGGDCPVAAFSVAAAIAATPTVVAPPVKGLYRYRQTGYISVNGRTGSPPPDAARAIQNIVDPNDGTFTFDVADAQPSGTVTLTSYLVDQRTGSFANDGIFITQIVTRMPDGSIDQFAPSTPVRIITLPADVSNPTWESAGTDGVHNLTMALNGTITKRGRIDACGTVLDSWEVHATGRIVNPAKSLSFDTTYDIGTQFGGLSLAETLSLSGTDGGPAVAPTAGASCTNGGGSLTVDTTTTIQQAVAACPGFVVSRDTAAAIASSPARPAGKA